MSSFHYDTLRCLVQELLYIIRHSAAKFALYDGRGRNTSDQSRAHSFVLRRQLPLPVSAQKIQDKGCCLAERRHLHAPLNSYIGRPGQVLAVRDGHGEGVEKQIRRHMRMLYVSG